MQISPDRTVVGFVGTGVMGCSMAGHILKAGFRLQVFNRTKAKAQPLLEKGAVWQSDPRALAKECNVVITIVGFPADVEAVYMGQDGLIPNGKPGLCLIDMTTSKPSLAVRLAEEGAKRGIHVLDAPVSGGDVGAREARLSIMVGGDEEAFNSVLPLLQAMGKNIIRQGPAGCGQHTKMVNQIAIACNMMGVCEAMAYAQKAGLDPSSALKSIETGAAGSWSLTNLAPRILAGNFAPGFYVKHFIKDMRIALESADEMKLDLPGLRLARSLYEKLAAQGGENDGTQALFRLYGA